MQNIFTKPNAPYLTTGTLAAITLLASGVLAAAPYIGFLAPVVALNLGIPFIIGCALFSVVVMALSYSVIAKNNKIESKEDINAELKREKSKLAAENAELKEQKSALEKQVQATGEEEISTLNTENAKFKQETNELATNIESQTNTLQGAFNNLHGEIKNMQDVDVKKSLEDKAEAFNAPLAILNGLSAELVKKTQQQVV